MLQYWLLSTFLLHATCSNLEPCTRSTDCQDPLNSECVDSVCTCRPGLNSSNGLCLELNLAFDSPCWLSSQCTDYPLGSCRRPLSGRILDDILEPLWEAYVDSNGSERFTPGRCRCARGHRNESRDQGHVVCVKRTIGSSCKTSYECSSRTAYSDCSARLCQCFDGFEYNSALDSCSKAATLDHMAGQLDCDHLEAGLLCPVNRTIQFLIKENFANLIGFSASMGFILLAWFVCWKCNGDDADDEDDDNTIFQGHELRFQSIVPNVDLGQGEEEDEDDSDPEYLDRYGPRAELAPADYGHQLPSYDEAMVGLQSKRSADQVINSC
ncbi:hypothetical protein HDE_03606 [Halotydeus destructor]|nr:hypothetical protein HDE_03606 [Halotydeus destructor]